MSNIDLTITDQTPISLEITTSNVEVISNTTLEFNPTQDIVALEIYPAVVYSVGGGGAAAGVNSISNAQGTATGDVTLSGTSVKISKTGNDFAFAVDPSSPFFNATMEQLTAGNGLLGGTITTSGTISADFGTVANKIMEGNDSRVTGLKTMAYQESNNINVTGGIIQNVYVNFNGYTHSRINEAQFVYVTNRTGSTISKGSVVYIVDALGDILRIGLAQADVEATSVNVLGLASADIADNANGYVMVKGEFVGVRTNNIGSEGDTVYLSETDAGGMRVGIPEAPNHGVRIGVIVKSAGPDAGIIHVDVDNYQELSELSDVHISGISGGQTIQWNNSTSRWENAFPYRLIEGVTFTSSTTYTFPTGARFVIGRLVGGGGGGAAGGRTAQSVTNGGGGGAGGGYREFQYDISHYAVGATAIVTIGAGGAGGFGNGSNAAQPGTDGGHTIFDIWEVTGGVGGGVGADEGRGTITPGIARSNTLTDHLTSAGGQRRSAINNPGFNGGVGWFGGGGGGGGAPTSVGAAIGYAGGQGGQSCNRISNATAVGTGTIVFTSGGLTSGAGGGGVAATTTVVAKVGLTGDMVVAGGGGGGGASRLNGAAAGNGATGGYPGGGGGGGGGNEGATGQNGGAGAAGRVIIWVYG